MTAKRKSNNSENQWVEEIAKHIKSLSGSAKTEIDLSPRSKKRFKKVTKIKLTTIQCPNCLCKFGLETKFINSIDDGINFQYSCPYCGKMGRIEND